jgi:serine/threonine-protein kinase
MSDITAEKLNQRIIDAGLLDSRQLESLWAELGTREASAEAFTSVLLRKELLTNYQVDRLIKGERGGYFYGEYKVLYLVGTGTFARVYRSVNIRTGRIVAVKALRRRFRDDKAMCEQFLREGQIGIQLRHPNIVPIYEVMSQPSPTLIMEFVEGSNLREFVRGRKKLSPLESMRLAVDILAGLAYAAERGMTHRDLKMSNVLITSRGKAKLVDFGLAGMQPGGNPKDEDAGNPRTIDYAGLERASGVRNNDPRSDLFFAGVILYNMLTGASALAETRDRLTRLSVARYQDIKPITHHDPTIPPRLATFVMRSLELNPEKRYASAAEMYDDAKRLLDRMEAGDLGESDAADSPAAAARPAAIDKVALSHEGAHRTIMVVESKIEMQDLLRDRLKKHGYRVLIFSDPQRAITRFATDDRAPADCVLFCAQDLGDAALEAFNKLASGSATKDVPAILFVDSKQTDLIKGADVAPHRVILTTPLRVRELRETLLKLLQRGHSSIASG